MCVLCEIPSFRPPLENSFDLCRTMSQVIAESSKRWHLFLTFDARQIAGEAHRVGDQRSR